MNKERNISFLLDKKELKLLNNSIIINEEIVDIIERAKPEDNKYRLRFSYECLDELLGFIAAEANHTKPERKQERLDELYEKMKGLLALSKLVSRHGTAKVIKKKKPRGKVYVFDVWLDSQDVSGKILRKLAIQGQKSLYNFAKAIVESFDFYFDHCFGFYDNLKNSHNSKMGYELFVDIGEEPSGGSFKGVKRTKIRQVFGNAGDKMLFFFDYGDSWHFIVELKKIRDGLLGESKPVLLESIGKAPMQYPPCDDF